MINKNELLLTIGLHESYYENLKNNENTSGALLALGNLKHVVENWNGWISINDNLPDPGEMVLVSVESKNGNKSVNRAWVDEKGSWHGSGSMAGVKAWMPLPLPYVEVEE